MINMNKQLKAYGVLITIFASTTSFGMQRGLELAKQNGYSGKSTCFKRTVGRKSTDTFMSWDFPLLVAAVGDGKVKNKMSQTCKRFNQTVHKKNPNFVCMPTFIAHPKDMNEIALFFSWNNNVRVVINEVEERVVGLIGKKIPTDEISFEEKSSQWSIGGYNCDWPNTFKLDYPNQLRTKYVEENAPIDCVLNQHNYQLPCQTEEALLFALLCKDEKAVAILAPKIRAVHGEFSLYTKSRLHDDLFLKLIERDDVKAFELAAKHDPYGALNLYWDSDKTGEYDKPFLDRLMENRYISKDKPEHRDKYVQIYAQYGGKTRDELKPKKEMCIIS